VILVGLILLIGIAIWAKGARWTAIDTCLEGSGHWDSETGSCLAKAG